MAEPLNDGEWRRFWELLGQPARSAEEYDELADLHGQAQKYIDGWKPDPTITGIHLTAAVTQMARMLRGLYDILPGAGGLRSHIDGIQAAVENLSVALNGPASIPPLPDPPGKPATAPPAADWPSPEQAAALEPVGPTDGATDKKPGKKK
jgi:hypothetical protein